MTLFFAPTFGQTSAAVTLFREANRKAILTNTHTKEKKKVWQMSHSSQSKQLKQMSCLESERKTLRVSYAAQTPTEKSGCLGRSDKNKSTALFSFPGRSMI